MTNPCIKCKEADHLFRCTRAIPCNKFYEYLESEQCRKTIRKKSIKAKDGK